MGKFNKVVGRPLEFERSFLRAGPQCGVKKLLDPVSPQNNLKARLTRQGTLRKMEGTAYQKWGESIFDYQTYLSANPNSTLRKYGSS